MIQPEIRFDGFIDEWVEKKLGDVANRVTRKNKNNESNRVLTISAQDGLVDQLEYFNKQIASRDVSGYFLMKNGEFAYNKSYSNGHPWGAIKRLDKYDVGVLSSLYIVFQLKSIDSQFLVSYYDSNTWYKEISINATEGARNHGLLNISPVDFFNTLLNVPESFPEQQKIGALFSKYDAIIASREQKLEELNALKKGLLQQMFPKNDAKVPELRFEGFEDEWVGHKLKDVLDISKTKNKAQLYGKADVLSVSREVGTVNQIEYQGRSFAGSDLSNYKVVQGGELIYTKSPLKGAPYGIFQVATIKGILSPLYAVYTSTDKAYTPFVAMALKNDNIATHYLTPLVTKGSKNTINVTDEGALEGKIQFPSILEQKQIFIFFKQLDDHISNERTKIEQLKAQKQGLLQRML